MAVGRNGIRPFSSEKHIHSERKELMTSYDSGIVSVSDVNKSIISVDEINRFNAHIERFKKDSFNNNIYNDIYQIEDIGLLNIKSYKNGENILKNVVNLPRFSKYLFSLDSDILVNENNISIRGDNSYIKVSFEFEVFIGVYSSIETRTLSLDSISNTIIDLSASGVTDVKLNKVSFTYDNTEYLPYKLLLHSVLVTGK